ncbi:MAG: hypothetical protein QOI54_3680 [Actinomycetota bacterium]|jgi:hypothetical protein|nr:hypothetical protein [Actinomycetota bacterium]
MARDVDYVLPLKWDAEQHALGVEDLTEYLQWLSGHARIIVVDGSPPALFLRHHQLWGEWVTHIAPDPLPFRNGKVSGVHTGLRQAGSEAVVIADDDVRYDAGSLRRTVELLSVGDLVGPQNVFDPMPWHAAWDSARSLLNRAVAADYPGTYAVRRSVFWDMGGYDGDVLFENLELMRSVRAYGGRIVRPRGIYVRRRPPSVAGFLSQRVRQAFDDVAQPWRLATVLPVLPTIASGPRGRRVVAAGLLASIVLAEAGRRRAGGADWFPARASLLAPAWIAERSVCSWLALAQRAFLGGVRYGGQRIAVAAHSNAQLRREAAARRALVAPGGREAGAVGTVAERLERGTPAAAQRDGVSLGVDLRPVHVGDPEPAA